MRTLFDEVFEQTILYPEEKAFYRKNNLLNLINESDVRPCDMFGGIHLLRFIMALSIIATTAVPANGSGGIGGERERSVRQRSASTSSHSSSVSSSSSSNRKSTVSSLGTPVQFLCSDSTISTINDILRDLENIFPLASIC